MNNLLKIHHPRLLSAKSASLLPCVVLRSFLLSELLAGICIHDEMAKVAKHRYFVEIVSSCDGRNRTLLSLSVSLSEKDAANTSNVTSY